MGRADRAVRAKAADLGFDAVGVARADIPLEADFERYVAFLRDERHGGMGYLARNREVRRGLANEGILPGARSVVCVAQRYSVAGGESADGIARLVAKYARGRDYHTHVRRRLRKLAEFMRSVAPGTRARPLIDTAPVLERAWAARSGLGFVGKNGMLIVPGLGSFTVLGEVVTDLDLEPGEPMPPRCGRCEACLRACPTGALVRPFVLDARMCIGYLTVEHRGPWDRDWSGVIAPRLFGCDDCQDVCPFNRARGAWIDPGGPFDPHPRWPVLSRRDLLACPEDELARLFEGSPLRRLTHDDLRRNVLGSYGQNIPAAALPLVQGLARDARAPAWLAGMAENAVALARSTVHGDGS